MNNSPEKISPTPMPLLSRLVGRRLILASASPRRKQIMEACGLPFTLAQPPDTKEVWPENLPADKVAQYLAALKSELYPHHLAPGEILLTADTTVVSDGRVLGKPDTLDHAKQMLRELSGRSHEVVTGVCLRWREKHASFTPPKFSPGAAENTVGFSVTSTVTFRDLTAQMIDHYVDTFRPLDKAGAYGIQEWIGLVGVSRIEGSFHNVMGLPIQAIYTKLEQIL